jgi:hypothetical protein
MGLVDAVFVGMGWLVATTGYSLLWTKRFVGSESDSMGTIEISDDV